MARRFIVGKFKSKLIQNSLMVFNKGEFMSTEKAPKSQTEFDEDAFYNEMAEQDFLFRLFEQGVGDKDDQNHY